MRCLSSVALLLTFLAASPVWAEDAEADERDTTYIDHLNEGHRLVLNNQHDAALRAYQAALEAVPGDGMATYFIASAQQAAGQMDEALASYQRAVERAGDDDALHARALMSIAFVQERRGELGAAREAWRAYVDYAEAHQSVPTYIANARQRLDAITSVEELNAAYVQVRERIATRAASAASSGN